jgi:hypothetical protein
METTGSSCCGVDDSFAVGRPSQTTVAICPCDQTNSTAEIRRAGQSCTISNYEDVSQAGHALPILRKTSRVGSKILQALWFDIQSGKPDCIGSQGQGRGAWPYSPTPASRDSTSEYHCKLRLEPGEPTILAYGRVLRSRNSTATVESHVFSNFEGASGFHAVRC